MRLLFRLLNAAFREAIIVRNEGHLLISRIEDEDIEGLFDQK